MITVKQATSLTINAIVTKMLLTFPRAMFLYCKNSAWLAGLYATLVAIGVFFVIKKAYSVDKNVIQTAEMMGGKGLRSVTGVAVFIVLGANIVPLMRIFPEIIRLVLLQKTYFEIIITVFALVMIFCASCGIEAIARVVEMFLPIAGVVFAAFLLMLIPEFDGKFIFPLFGGGAYGILYKGLSGLSIFSDLLTLNILIPFMKGLDCYKRAGTRAIITGGVCATLILLVYGLCYVYPASTKFAVPIYQLERLINLSEFFSRLEALFQFVWTISILLYFSLYIAVMAEVWCESFGLTHSKPLVAPTVIILVGFSLLPQSLNVAIVAERYINMYVFIPAFLIPVIIGGIYKIKMFHVKHSEGTHDEK